MATRTYDLVGFGPLVGQGVTDARYARLQAVAKTNGPNAPYCVPNEIICAELGRVLRLPIPPFVIVRGAGDPRTWFASMDFNLQQHSLPPVNAARCVAALPRESAGLLLFDVWVANSDRHARNFAVDTVSNPAVMTVFDHSHALFGPHPQNAQVRMESLRDRLGVTGGPLTRGNRHCLLDAIRHDEGFSEWVARIGAVPDYFLNDLCNEVVPYGVTPSEALAAADFLKYRRDAMASLLAQHRAEFRSIPQ